MNRILAYLLGMALLFLLSTCDIVYAQNLPNQLKVPSFQNTGFREQWNVKPG